MQVGVRFGSYIDGELVTMIGSVPGITAKCEWEEGLSPRSAEGRTFRISGLTMRTNYPIESGQYVMLLTGQPEKLDVWLDLDPVEPDADPMVDRSGAVLVFGLAGGSPFRLQHVRIEGYRPFRDFSASFGGLEVLAGANGSGKSSLFEFLRFLRDGMRAEIPAEIIPGAVGQELFHNFRSSRLHWTVRVGFRAIPWIEYEGELLGPVGRPQITLERVVPLEAPPVPPEAARPAVPFMEVEQGRGTLRERQGALSAGQQVALTRRNQLALGTVNNPQLSTLYMLRDYLARWRFYSAYQIDSARIRRPAVVEQTPELAEDGSNLSAVLHYLLTEHRSAFEELQQHLRSAVPGFRSLSVKARGGPGEVIAFWRESGVDRELNLADLSDGILRLICWMVLCLQPKPPALICIDEPELGVHPRTLPILAGLFDKACERTQLLLATHSSYFLSQFHLSQIAVMRKEGGAAVFVKPEDSQTLRDMLQEFGSDEIERLHRSDELERLA